MSEIEIDDSGVLMGYHVFEEWEFEWNVNQVLDDCEIDDSGVLMGCYPPIDWDFKIEEKRDET